MRQIRNRRTRDILGLALFAVLYYFLARFGMAFFSLEPENITLLWLPSGIALVMCRQWGYRAFPYIVIASFSANYPGMVKDSTQSALIHTGIASIADGLVGILSMYAMNYFLPHGLTHTRNLVPFGIWVCLIPTSITGLILSFNLAIGGYIQAEKIGGFFRMLILADSLGMLLVYQIFEGWHGDKAISKRQGLSLLGGILSIILILGFSFTSLPGLVFFIIPIIIILSFNVSLFLVTTISTLTIISILIATAKNLGIFAGITQIDSHFTLMAFVFASGLTFLGVALQNQQLILSQYSSKVWKDAALHDSLTGLINRRAFLPILENQHQRTTLSGKIYSFAILDLDYFKKVNDTYGHLVGDKVLCAFAEILNKNCRSTDSIVRMGGEEFGLMFPDCNLKDALPVLERIRHELANKAIKINGNEIFLTVSIGVAAFILDEESSGLINRADKALYAAKSAGRNRVMVAS